MDIALPSAFDKPNATKWGLLPQLCFIGAFSLVLVSIADTGARRGAAWSEGLFWFGLLVLFVPITSRLLSREISRHERIGLVVILGLGCYCIKLLNSPLLFTYPDELKHWRTTTDILQSQHLFVHNSLLPVGPFFPGLEIAVMPLISLSGLDIFPAGIILIGMARLLLIIALFLFFEEVSKSSRVASIAILLFITNPTFLFFDSQFSYESLAIAFIVLSLFAISRGLSLLNANRKGFLGLALVFQGALITIHHVSGYFLVIFLILWTIIYSRRGNQEHDQLDPSSTMLIALVTTVTWIIYVAYVAIKYLVSNLSGPLVDIFHLISEGTTLRRLFSDSHGLTVPIWEQVLGYIAVVLILGGLLPSFVHVWRRYHNKSIIMTLSIVALIYPLTHILRFTENGSEIAGRFAPFVFLGLAFVLSIGFVEPYLIAKTDPKKWIFVFGSMIVIFMGGVIVSFPYWGRMPGPYLVSADMRSVDSQGIQAAKWMRNLLGSDNRIGTDRINGLIMGSYGQQYQVTSSYDGVNVSRVFLSPTIGPEEIGILQQGRIQYLVVDLRLTSSLPVLGFYFEHGELISIRAIRLSELTKFDNIDHVSRIFDSNDIIIYDIRMLSHAP